MLCHRINTKLTSSLPFLLWNLIRSGDRDEIRLPRRNLNRSDQSRSDSPGEQEKCHVLCVGGAAPLCRWCWPRWWTSPWRCPSSRRRPAAAAPLWSHDSSTPHCLHPAQRQAAAHRVKPPSNAVLASVYRLAWRQSCTKTDTLLAVLPEDDLI